MAGTLNECNTSLETAVHDPASKKSYFEKRNLVLHLLQTTLSLHRIKDYRKKFELFKKSYFYVEIEPHHTHMRDQNHTTADIMQNIDNYQLQRVKKKGKNLIEIKLSLLADLLEQLEGGQEELKSYISACDMITFLSQWHLIEKRLSQLSEFMKTLISLQVPGKLYIKHPLLLQAYFREATPSVFKVSLHAKMPLIFDRNESFAHKDWAKLKWFTENQEPHLEPYILHFKLLTSQSRAEMGYRRMQEVTSNTCIVQGLQPGRSYEFTIRRQDTQTFIFVKWHDSITLTTTLH